MANQRSKLYTLTTLALLLCISSAAQDMKLGAYFTPGIGYRILNIIQVDTTSLFSETDKSIFASEAGVVAQWYPEKKFHVEGGFQLGKKGFKSIEYGGNKYLDYTGIEIIGDPPIQVVSKVEFYYLSLNMLVGYDVYKYKSITAGARAGFLVDAFLWNIVRQKASYSDRTENIIIHPDFEGLKHFNISASVSMYVNYLISEEWEVGLEPCFNIALLKSMETEDLNMRFFNVGLRASVYLLLDFGSSYKKPNF